MKGLCAKQTVIAVITKGNKYWIGTNSCKNPQEECPRKGMASGEGYELCRSICGQEKHAEVDALDQAGEEAKGATLYLIGHSYCCENCMKEIDKHKTKVVIVKNLYEAFLERFEKEVE